MLPVTMVDSKGNTVTGVKDIEANGYTSILSIKPTTTGTEGNLSQTAGIYVTGYNNYGQLFNQDTKTLTSLTKSTRRQKHNNNGKHTKYIKPNSSNSR